jgi:hypothetical protein
MSKRVHEARIGRLIEVKIVPRIGRLVSNETLAKIVRQGKKGGRQSPRDNKES